MFVTAQFTIGKLYNQPRCPSTDEWIKEMCYIYTKEYYLAMRKKEMMTFASKWMEPENIMLSEISQSPQKPKTKCSLWYANANTQYGRKGRIEVHWIRQRRMKGSRDGNKKDSGMNWTSLPYAHIWIHDQWNSTSCKTTRMGSYTPCVYNTSKYTLLSWISKKNNF